MKKIFTLALALMGFAAATNAATVDDLAVLKHSYVLVCDQLGTRPGKGVLFGNDHFLDVTGGSTATNKGQVDLSVVDALGEDGTPLYVTQDIVDKYGADYAGPHYNWLRLKNAQDVIAMKLTAKSKVIMFLQGNNKVGKEARIPKIATDAALSNALNAAPDENHPSTVSGFRWEYTVDDDGLYYFGSYNGDMFVSFIIIEANEAPGTPTVKVGDQTFEGGLWFREVTCKANDMVEEGSTEKIPTVVTYTTDGSAPTAASPIYTEPIKCYQNMTVKFQAFMNLGDGKPADDFICDGADNEGNVNFVFSAPAIAADGASFTITSPYAEQNGENYYKLNGGEEVKGDGATLTESATVTAYTKIANGEYATFTTQSTTKDVYVQCKTLVDTHLCHIGPTQVLVAIEQRTRHSAGVGPHRHFEGDGGIGVVQCAVEIKGDHRQCVGHRERKLHRDARLAGGHDAVAFLGHAVVVGVVVGKTLHKGHGVVYAPFVAAHAFAYRVMDKEGLRCAVYRKRIGDTGSGMRRGCLVDLAGKEWRHIGEAAVVGMELRAGGVAYRILVACGNGTGVAVGDDDVQAVGQRVGAILSGRHGLEVAKHRRRRRHEGHVVHRAVAA